MRKKKSSEYEIKFWKEWLEADSLKRHELVKKLPFFKMCLKLKDDKMWRHSFAIMLNDYFKDLEGAVYTKIRLEQEKKKNRK